jgi:pSer/pThr/pTyr-binding forkhead associated (FHA) protein
MSEPVAAWIVTHDGVVWNLRKFELPIRIGRSDDAEIVVKMDTVSRIHAIIDWNDDTYIVNDNGSENHTWVDGIMLISSQDAPLSDGSVIMIGTVQLKYFSDGVNAARHAGSLREG